jgi:hypothetical protein
MLGNIPPSPYAFRASCLIRHIDNFSSFRKKVIEDFKFPKCSLFFVEHSASTPKKEGIGFPSRQ